MNEKEFYIVLSDISDALLDEHLLHGWESRWDFYYALRRLVNLWKGRVGECIGERHGFLHLRFHDTPGGRPDEAWVPRYLLQSAPMPDYLSDTDSDDPTPEEIELDEAFGFD